MKTLLVNGDSFLCNRHGGVDVNHTVAELLHAEHFVGHDMIKLAQGGSGNDRTFLSTINWFERHPERKLNAHVLICWTESQRIDYPARSSDRNDFIHHTPPMDQTWSTFALSAYMSHPWDTVISNIIRKFRLPEPHYPDWTVVKWYQNVLGLQNYLKANGIDYTFYNSLPPSLQEDCADHAYWRQAVDQNHFYKINYSQYEYCQDNQMFISDNNHHPNEQAHINWAKQLIEFIQ